MSRHVVFGTGQVGSHVVTQLVAAGEDVVAVSRRGSFRLDGATTVAGDATDPAFTVDVCDGADVVFFCLDAPDYHRWPEQFPPLQRGVLAGARAAGPGTRLVVLENLYGYGPVNGAPLTESLPMAGTSAKARTRIAMTEELLTAHAAGEIEAVIGRASDYFGPGCSHSALGELVFEHIARGKTVQVMGDIDTRHSSSYTPDVARALIALATAGSDVTGQVWHLPVADAWTTRRIIAHVSGLAGRKPRSFAAGALTLRALGLVDPAMKEYLHTLYQFTSDWIVDDTRFVDRFGWGATPMEEALAATYEWAADQVHPGVTA
jgi:nucleoside-diphosphate-sugar epimerase